MTADTFSRDAETKAVTQQRKRNISGSCAGIPAETAGKEQTPAVPAKRGRKAVSNNGWGDLFKSREDFVEMHLA